MFKGFFQPFNLFSFKKSWRTPNLKKWVSEFLHFPPSPSLTPHLNNFCLSFFRCWLLFAFLAKKNYLSEVADLHGVSIPSASRILHFFCPALYRQLNNINFPTTADELKRVKDVFYKIAHFPNVVGTIDGTRIPIQGMSGDDEPNIYFTCRKGFPSIHVYNY